MIEAETWPWWRRSAEAFLDVFFPRECVHCGQAVEASPGARPTLRHLCPGCTASLVRVGPPACSRCGHPFFGAAGPETVCPHCRELEPCYGEGRTAILLRGPGRSLVHALKYHAGLYLAGDLARLFAAAPGLADFAAGAELVPVPLHPRKLRERSFNQSEILARALARVAHGSRVALLLRRCRDTTTQTRLDREARRLNLQNAFALAKAPAVQPNLRYVIVDDVFTTGATVNACAAVLRKAGAGRVDVVTFGHG